MFLVFIVYGPGAFKYTSSNLLLLIFLDFQAGVFWVFWDLLLFLSSFSAILLGDEIT